MATIVAMVVGLSFQGSRGLWEPDEGRYVNAAMEMLEAGDWVVPKLHGFPYLDKPPLHYWAIAAGLRLWGYTEFGARFFTAIVFVLTSLLVGRLSQELWGGLSGPLAQIFYAVTLLPAMAAFVLTPDSLLALFTTGALFLYWRLVRDEGVHRWSMGAALGLCIGLGALAKGPAVLVFVAPLAMHALIRLGPKRLLGRADLWLCVAVSGVLGLWWYVAIAERLPGALGYLVDNHVVGRLWHSRYARSPETWRALVLYVPVLTLGMLPTSIFWLKGLPRVWKGFRTVWRDGRAADWLSGGHGLLLIAVVLPSVVLGFASSKLTLYVLPLAAPLVVATSSQWTRGRRSVMVAVGVSMLLVLGVKSAAVVVEPETSWDGARVAPPDDVDESS